MILGVGLGNAIPQDRLDSVFSAEGGSASWEGVSVRASPSFLLPFTSSGLPKRLVRASSAPPRPSAECEKQN